VSVIVNESALSQSDAYILKTITLLTTTDGTSARRTTGGHQDFEKMG